MLLRSSSTPILYIPQSSAVADSCHRSSPKPISMTTSRHDKIQRTPSDGNMRQTAVPKKPRPPPLMNIRSIGSQDSLKDEGTDNIDLSMLSLAGGDVGSKGGAQGFGDHGEGKQMMDDYYQNMIKTYPGETLLLANYAKFLKEVRGDLVKAEEYCERAVLVKPDDGEVLSMYGDLIWTNHKDEARAQSFFDRAVQASPNDW
ncbi:Tetratricopeptide TPR-1 [Gossypium australe]|uniref:Tetratricopeptide TPR-1 n=1 Tax=Gossypium australe TaxID=47621 RepID=A0A5B6W935_9ROSI|nr:Tetratricopeptide TPR-1 [Gossypium australe]